LFTAHNRLTGHVHGRRITSNLLSGRLRQAGAGNP
jgi:hypothetical protein